MMISEVYLKLNILVKVEYKPRVRLIIKRVFQDFEQASSRRPNVNWLAPTRRPAARRVGKFQKSKTVKACLAYKLGVFVYFCAARFLFN
jgi:hypothetical protein